MAYSILFLLLALHAGSASGASLGPRLLRSESLGRSNGTSWDEASSDAEASVDAKDRRTCHQPHERCMPVIRGKGFMHKGVTWNECIDYLGQWYCATKEKEQEDEDWELCTACNDCGRVEPDCKATFTYNGKTIEGCTYEGDPTGMPWCSHVSTFTEISRQQKQFSYCRICDCPMCQDKLEAQQAAPQAVRAVHEKNPQARAECWQPTLDCRRTFEYNGKEVTNCTDEDSPGVFWCSKIKRASSDTFKTGFKDYCTLSPDCGSVEHVPEPARSEKDVNADTCWLPDESCLSEFKFGETALQDCTRMGGAADPWCSSTEQVEAPTGLSCTRTSCEMCHIPDPECVKDWSVLDSVGKNRSMKGCSWEVSHPDLLEGEAWCSLSSSYDISKAGGYKTCRACQSEKAVNIASKKSCWIKDEACAAEFTHDGAVHKGCVEQEDGQAFCSETTDVNVDNKWLKCKPCETQAVTTYTTTVAGDFTMDILSDVMSGTTAQGVTYAKCPVGFTRTSCNCFDEEGSCAGAKFKDDGCAAYNKPDGKGVWAQARCINLPPGATWSDAQAIAEKGSNVAVASCELGFQLASCNCFQADGKCLGARPNGSYCEAHGIVGQKHTNVVATARCAKIAGSSNWKTVFASVLSASSAGAVSAVACPAEQTLVACGCFSDDGSCAGAKASKDTCNAYNRASGSGVKAWARCAELQQERWCWAFDSQKTMCQKMSPEPPATLAPPEVGDVKRAKRACENLGEVCGGIIATEVSKPLLAWQGCYTDPRNRDVRERPSVSLSDVDPGAREWSAQSCGEACILDGSHVIALRWKAEASQPQCYCGSTYMTYPDVKRLPDSQCGKQCAAAPPGSFRPCGGKRKNAIYRIGKSPADKIFYFKPTSLASQGKSSNCKQVRCDSKEDSGEKGLKQCMDHCRATAECNTFNFCSSGSDCKNAVPEGGEGRCCQLQCEWSNSTMSYNPQLTDAARGWDVYQQTPSPRMYEEGPKVSKEAVAHCSADLWTGTKTEAMQRCDASPACTAIMSVGCESTWHACNSSQVPLMPPRFMDKDRSSCTMVVIEKSSWLPCVGRCNSKGSFRICPVGTYLTEITFSVSENASGVQSVWPEEGVCSDGSKFIPDDNKQDRAGVPRQKLSRPEGASSMSINAWVGGADVNNVSVGVRYFGWGTSECAVEKKSKKTSSCSLGLVPKSSDVEPMAFLQCPQPRQRLAGWRVTSSGPFKKAIGLELFCGALPPPSSIELPCAGNCKGTARRKSCPQGAVVEQLFFASNNQSELYLTGGACTDGTIYRQEDMYPESCRENHKVHFNVSVDYGASEVSLNENLASKGLTALRLGSCPGLRKSCNLVAPGGGPATKTLKCPEAAQSLVGWTSFTSCQVHGLKFLCNEVAPLGPGWLACQGRCNTSPTRSSTATCSEGHFVNSIFLRHNADGNISIQSATCSDGETIGAAPPAECAQELRETRTLAAPKGVHTLVVRGLVSGGVLSFVGVGDCDSAECAYGVESGASKELRCPGLGQRIAGWSLQRGTSCGTEGLQLMCREPGEPTTVAQVQYCQPKTFVNNPKKFATNEPRPAAYTPTACSGVCDEFSVKEAGNDVVNGKYALDTSVEFSDNKPVWSKRGGFIKRYLGKWTIEANGERLYVGGEGGNPPPGRWAPIGTTAGPGPTVFCKDGEGVQLDPCWKPAKDCVAIFAYEGVTYKGCTRVGSTQHWCGTDKFVTKDANWAMCTDDLECRQSKKKVVKEVVPAVTNHDCYLPAPTCQKTFTYKDLMHTECIDDHNDGSHWCSEDTVFDDSVGRWKPCRKTVCKEGKVLNVALHRDVEASSAAEGGPPDRATDGDGNGGRLQPYGSCAETLAPSPGEFAWVKVDLRDEFAVLEIQLVGRDDDFGYQSRGWKLTIGNNGSLTDNVCADGVDVAGGQNVPIKCGIKPPGLQRPQGRYVTVWSAAAIVLCEIEVMGQACYRPHADCALTFATRSNPDEAVSGCMVDEFHTAWCSLDENFEGRWKECETVSCTPRAPEPPPVVEECVMPDPLCTPIFDYKGKIYHGCTDVDSPKLNQFGEPKDWCSRDAAFANHALDCTGVPCRDCWVRDPRCVMNFTYDGKSYTGCTKLDSSAYWCSLNDEFDGNSKNRRFCHRCQKKEPKKRAKPMEYVDDWPTNRFCWKIGDGCVDSFQLEGEAEMGCMTTMHKRPWCSKDDNYVGNWGFCKPDEEAWQPHSLCVEQFEYNGKMARGCVMDNTYEVPWCSIDAAFKGDFKPCAKCAKDPSSRKETQLGQKANSDAEPDESCYDPPAACVPVFQYKGVRFQGCTNEDSLDFWCSHAEVYSEDRGFSLCTKGFCRTANPMAKKYENQEEMTAVFTIEKLRFDKIGAELLVKVDAALAETMGERIGLDRSAFKLTLSGEEAEEASGGPISASLSERRAADRALMVRAAGDVHVKAVFHVGVSERDRVLAALPSSESRAAIVHALSNVPAIGKAEDGPPKIRTIEIIERDFVAVAANAPSKCWKLHPDCVPTFTFEGKHVSGCIKQGASHHWCSLHDIYRGSSERCTDEPCEQCWNVATGCKQSFKYKGKTFAGCTNEDSDSFWCSLAENLDRSRKEWKPCSPCSTHDEIVAEKGSQCFEPVEDCVSSFEYKGKAYTGCTKEHAAEYWCSLKFDLDDRSMNWRACRPCGAGTKGVASGKGRCYLPSDDCVGKFEYKDLLFKGCTNFESSEHWCSKYPQYTGNSGWGHCEPVGCDQCYVRHNSCVKRFKHNGQLVRGCEVDGSSGKAWCSADETFIDGTSPWFMCDPCAAWDEQKKESSKICHYPTASCTPTFEYKGKRHSGCIFAGESKPWCPFKYDHVEGSASWEYCPGTTCDECFIRDSRCSSPFTYEGKTYDSCVHTEGSVPWCSKGAEFRSGDAWFECQPCSILKAVDDKSPDEDVCYQPVSTCAPEFLYDGEMYTGCTQRGSSDYWCSADKTFDGQFSSCKRQACEVCFVRDAACLPEFTYNGHKVDGCTTEDAEPDKPWCSVVETAVNGVTEWKSCSMCAKESERRPTVDEKKCYNLNADCVTSFEYKGQEITGCTNLDSPNQWCSLTKSIKEGDVANRAPCVETPCLECFMRAPSCKTSFQYEGATYSGCIKTNSQGWWCSNDDVFVEETGSWEKCSPCSTNKKTCWKPAADCSSLFKYKGIEYSGCTSLDSEKHWCAKDYDYDATRRFAHCTQSECDAEDEHNANLACYEPPLDCEPQFMIGLETFSGCTDHDSAFQWCSHDAIFSKTSKWSRCLPKPCNDCLVRAAGCLRTFSLHGVMIDGCSTVSSKSPWCSHDAYFDLNKSDWSLCTPCNGYVKIKEKACYQPPASCLRNYFHRGQMFTGCTRTGVQAYDMLGHGKPWCSQVRDLKADGGEYLNCEKKDCRSCWIRAPGCVQAFKYIGNVYDACVTDEPTPGGGRQGTAWCSLRDVLEKGSDQWKLCDPCPDESVPLAVEECWKPPDTCVQPFQIDGKPTSGCKSDSNGRAWCSKVDNFNTASGESSEYEWCEEIECEKLCWQPSKGCVHFHIGDRFVTGCEEDGSGTPWCATEEVYDAEAGNWQYCKAVACDSICAAVDKACVQPFVYKGKTIVGCTTMDSASAWCSEVAEFLPQSTAWRHCQQTQCSNICYQPPDSCVQPYWFKGTLMTGCVRPHGSDDYYCPTSDELTFPSSTAVRCPQVSCGEVCYRPADGCKSAWTTSGGQMIHGCLTDKKLLKGQSPWCAKVQEFKPGGSEWAFCPQIPCSEAECLGPQCDGFLLLKGMNGQCVQAEGFNTAVDSFGLVLSDNCAYPDFNGVMVKEVPTVDGYVLFQHTSGRCMHPEGDNVLATSVRLIIKDECSDESIMKFQRVGKGKYFKLKHYSDRCIDVRSDDSGTSELVLSSDCEDKESNSATAALLPEVDERRLAAGTGAGTGLRLKEFPLPCVWADWAQWTDCSVSCVADGGKMGAKRRDRKVDRVQEEKGKPCLGDAFETMACGQPCPVDCVLGGWTPWLPCDAACGGGQQIRRKKIVKWPVKGGRPCPDVNETQECNTHPCPSGCKYGDWSEWGSCSKSCGSGVRHKIKEIARQPEHGGHPCGVPPKIQQVCGIEHCPKHCSLGAWGAWDPCTKSCGGGSMIRKREVTVEAAYGGKACGALPFETKVCAKNPCPIDCYWEEWLEWHVCSLSCGGGTRFRRRDKVPEVHGGRPCSPGERDQEDCNMDPCPENCIWASWQPWSDCTMSCAGGTRKRSRTYEQTARNGGEQCFGPREQNEGCADFNCPVDCVWDLWQEWGICTVSCGGGLNLRSRKRYQKMKNGGRKCVGYEREYRQCKVEVCPIDCNWNAWSAFSICSATCAGGLTRRTRTRRTLAENAGKPCEGAVAEEKACNSHRCPIDCTMSSWSRWSTCDKSCGVGMQNRIRTKTEAMFKGKACKGKLVQKRACNVESCPIDCKISAWSMWTECPKTCGGAIRSRRRDMISAQHGGVVCEGERFEENRCGEAPCPINCEWYSWEEWHGCSLTCDKGVRARFRQKKTKAENGGLSCKGDKKQLQPCNPWHCPVDCVWDEWQSWSMCTKSCGGGKHYREREMRRRSKYGGNVCRGDKRVDRWCMTAPCSMDYFGKPSPVNEEVITDKGAAGEDATNASSEGAARAEKKEVEEAAPGLLATFGIAVVGIAALFALPFLWKTDPAKP